MTEIRNAYSNSVGKPEGSIPPDIPTCRWKDNIKKGY
jgi:hypothetical protein